ncbi:Major pollen allergen bet v 1-a [Thalictrum thalictroides]|uniref:Major pollen allergen bet v 1-a n=1 Tax=Thalictrum thalictroides TaxID=46969 RepID=A0A7J6V906_THATH|nr:Major pollen allergen bet v 1-a [Thalictrum thalictroides]
MVTGSFTDEFTTPIPPKRFWSAAIVDSHILIPKIAPQYIESIELEGDGGAGTIKTYKFGQVVKDMRVVKNRVDMFDPENFLYKYSVVGGSGKFETASFQIKLEGCSDGGSLVKISGEYSTVGDYVPTETESNAAKGGTVRMLKAVEGYLIAKPDAYA